MYSDNRQLNNLVQFCCDPTKFRPFTVDPTFDIGDYNVTPVRYQHLLLENRSDGKHPSMIGPQFFYISTSWGSCHRLKDGERMLLPGANIQQEGNVYFHCRVQCVQRTQPFWKAGGVLFL